jgi:hypothetical protein
MALTNLGFGTLFNMNQPFSPTLARTNMTPGMMQLSPQPTPGGGAAPLYPSTANGIGGGAVPPGAAGAQSPGNILQQHPMTQFAQPAMVAAQPMPGQTGGGNPGLGGYQATLNGQALGQPQAQSSSAAAMNPQMLQAGLRLMQGAHQRPNTQAAQQAQTTQQIQAAQQLAQLLKQYNVAGLLGSGGGQ